MTSTDWELLKRAQEGDSSAFHHLVDRYAQTLFGLAFSLLRDAADAEDVVQETFLGAWKGMRSFEGRSSVKTWLIRIAVRQAVKRTRYRQRRRAVSLEDQPEALERGFPVVGTAPSAKAVDMRLDILDALEALSPEHRVAVVLRELEGMTYEEIAQALDIPQGTVESRLFRARQELRERLKDYLP